MMATAPRIVVIGGVAAGMSAASQAKRRQPDAQVIVVERGPHVSYGACGMPYNIEDPARDIEDLVVLTPARLREERGIDVRTHHEVVAIDSRAKSVRVRKTTTGTEVELPYDKLVVATGASPVRPSFPGIDRAGVFFLRELRDGAKLKQFLAETSPRKAVIIGAGYIGMEMAETLRKRSMDVTVIERLAQVLPGFEPPIARIALAELEKHAVVVETETTVHAIDAGDEEHNLFVQTDRGGRPADLVLVSVGVRPNVALAEQAGVILGLTGAIQVDAQMRTNVADIFAAGDCAEAHHIVSGEPAYIPLGTTANKQGKIAGANAAGARQKFYGIAGTAGFKVFDLEIARTGLGLADITRLAIDAAVIPSVHKSRGHAYPGSTDVHTVLLVERDTRRLLGAQMAGTTNVAARIDVFAAALQAHMIVDEIETLDLVYAPPLAPVYDPIAIAATVARKKLA